MPLTRRSFGESDLIRLKLQRLDEQTSTRPLLEKLFSSAPMLPFTIAFIAGIIFASRMPTLSTVWVTLCITIAVALACMIVPCKACPTRRLLLILIGSSLIIFALGTTRYYSLLDKPPDHISRYFSSDRELATLKGRIISPIRTDPLNSGISSIPWLSSKSSFYLETNAVKSSNGWQPACGRVRVQVTEPVDHVQPGDTVQIHCWLGRFSPPANPGQFDLANHMRQRGVHVAAAVGIKEGVLVIQSTNSPLSRLQNALYHYATGALFDETLTDDDARSLVRALLLGRRSSLSPRVTAAFQHTNLAHFISLSGMHVGIIAGSVWIVLRFCGLARRPRALLCIFLILLYATVVPPRAATLRAVFLSCFFFASVLIRRQPSPINTLAISAWALLAVRPWELFSAGWQLSFLSVLGILLLYPAVRYHLLTRLFYPVTVYMNRLNTGKRLLYKITELLAVGLSAWIIIAPILLFYFGRVNPLSPVWTVLVLPIVSIILYAGFAKILTAAIFPTLSSALGWILNFAATTLEHAVVVLSKVDLLQVISYRPELALVAGIYMLMLLLALLPYRFQATRKVILAAIVACFLWPTVFQLLLSKNGDVLEFTCLSVGHGQAAVLSGPDDQHILFDAGSITNQEISHKVIQPFLQHKGIFSLEAIYLSHGDMDHINAVSDLVNSVTVKNIYANQALLQTATEPSIEKQLISHLAQAGKHATPIESPDNTTHFCIKSIWPEKHVLNKKDIAENDKSEVFLIEYANRKILLCGDIERYAQNQLMELYSDLQVDVIVLPHHGSTNNLDKLFVEHFHPSAAIASCSRRTLGNAYRSPGNMSVDVFYTPTDGAVTVTIKADGTLNITGYASGSGLK